MSDYAILRASAAHPEQPRPIRIPTDKERPAVHTEGYYTIIGGIRLEPQQVNAIICCRVNGCKQPEHTVAELPQHLSRIHKIDSREYLKRYGHLYPEAEIIAEHRTADFEKPAWQPITHNESGENTKRKYRHASDQNTINELKIGD